MTIHYSETKPPTWMDYMRLIEETDYNLRYNSTMAKRQEIACDGCGVTFCNVPHNTAFAEQEGLNAVAWLAKAWDNLHVDHHKSIHAIFPTTGGAQIPVTLFVGCNDQNSGPGYTFWELETKTNLNNVVKTSKPRAVMMKIFVLDDHKGSVADRRV
ncbi:hypothetical protein LTR28_010124 [Elasticomyces elasticus]|nr:hypothetical protein LTR28_010124 [Elasticomyces elasticus]